MAKFISGDDLKKIFKKIDWKIIALAAVVALGIFLRVWHFHDWLYFQGDQARDAILVTKAYENGIGSLPLLGPRAGGTFTRLGPAFYYLEYVSVSIFGNDSPAVFAFPDLLFSVLSISLLYLFLRKFFKAELSVMLTLLYSVSLYAVQYSRFAWNPNSLPFFSLLFFYAFLNIFDSEGRKKKIIWSAVAGSAYAIASQLHFVSLVSLPIIIAAFVILRYKYIRSLDKFKWWQYAMVALIIVAVFYVPMIFSEILTNGNNSLNFLSTTSSKTSGSSLSSSVVKIFSKVSEYFLVIWTGIVAPQAWQRSIASVAIISGIFFNVALFLREKDEKKKNFLLIIILWLVGYFFIYAFVKAKINPRFFLPILPIPFILLGFIMLSCLTKFRAKFLHWLSTAFIIFLAVSNVCSVSIWFKEIKNSELSASNPRKSNLKKAVSADTWWHLEKTSGFMKNDCSKENILIFLPKKTYSGPFEYAMKYVGDERKFMLNWETAEVNSQACYYAVLFTKNISKGLNGKNFSKEKVTSFGDLSVMSLNLTNETAKDGQIISNPYRNKEKYSDVGNTDDDSTDETDDDQSADSSGENSASADGDEKSVSKTASLRMDRLYWKDVADFLKSDD